MINIIDDDFFKLINELKYLDSEEIYNNIKNNFDSINISIRFEIEKYYGNYEKCCDEFLKRANILKENIDDLIILYNNLNDYRSKKLLYSYLISIYEFIFLPLKLSNENSYTSYLDLDIINNDNDVLVIINNDINFINNYLNIFKNGYYKIYVLDNIKQDIVDNYKRVEFIDNIMDVSSLDISLIKINNNLYENIINLKDIISKNLPKLIINLNNIDDLIIIPKLIKDINNSYKFYIRAYCSYFNFSNIILIAK